MRPGLLLLAAFAVPACAQEPVRLYAAGSLRGAMTDIAETFEAQERIAQYLLSAPARAILSRYGFAVGDSR